MGRWRLPASSGSSRRSCGFFCCVRWPYLLEYARGEPSCWDRCIEAGAHHLVEIAKANAADEIVVVGHSGGGVTAPALLARALQLDPELGRHGPRVVLLTPGSL